jgi:hypothetical protein
MTDEISPVITRASSVTIAKLRDILNPGVGNPEYPPEIRAENVHRINARSYNLDRRPNNPYRNDRYGLGLRY